MEIWATPTHPPLRTYTNLSLASCILVQLSDLCNVEGMPVTGGGGVQARLALHLPNSLIYKKSLPNCCLRAKQVWKIGNFMYFWTKNSLKFRNGSSFVRFAPWNYAYLACQIQNFPRQGTLDPLERLAQALRLLATLAINWVPHVQNLHKPRRNVQFRNL